MLATLVSRLIGLSKITARSRLGLARRIGIGGEFHLVAERVVRLGRNLLLLRFSDLALAVFLSLGHR